MKDENLKNLREAVRERKSKSWFKDQIRPYKKS